MQGSVKTAKQNSKLTEEQTKEFVKCFNNVYYFLENYVYVQHPTKGAVKFELRDYQKRVVNGITTHNKNIILQPRQSGKTITIVGILLHYAIFTPDMTIGVAAHKGSGAKEIISRFRYAYENLPVWMKPVVTSYNVYDVAFMNGSKIISQTTTEGTFRGMSISLLYLDEFAFIKPRIADEFWKSILPTVSAEGSKMIITSTPNGSENRFAEIWFKALQNENDFNAIEVRNEEVPGRESPEFKRQMLMDMTELEYAQEYENQFISSSGTLIHSPTLESIRYSEPLYSHGDLRVFSDLKDRCMGISVDVGSGVGKDYSVIQVFDMMSFEQIAEYRNNTLNLTDFTKELIRVFGYLRSHTKKDIYYTIESNSIGQAVLRLLENVDNPIMESCELISEPKHLGIMMTAKSKKRGCTLLKDLIESKRMTIHSKFLISELKFFVKVGETFKAESGKHDDLVMSCVLFCLMAEEVSYSEDVVYDKLNNLHLLEDLEGIGSDEPMPMIV